MVSALVFLIVSLLGDFPQEERVIDYCAWIELNHKIDSSGEKRSTFYLWDGPGRAQMIGNEEALPNNRPIDIGGGLLQLNYTDWNNVKRSIYAFSFVETFGEPEFGRYGPFISDSGYIYAERGLSEPIIRKRKK